MGKSRKTRFEAEEDTVWVALEDIYISEATWDKLLRREAQQIEDMRDRFERGLDMVRVVLHYRANGGYTIEDGRHRVIAAKLADAGFIEAIVIGG
jgi:ParB-like chromosome segregation protein Spo0J